MAPFEVAVTRRQGFTLSRQ